MQKIHIHQKYQHLKPQLLSVINDFNNQGEYVLKGQRNHIKKIKLEGIELNIKQFRNPSVFNAFIYKFIRKSKAQRSFEYAMRLQQNRIQTPKPIAYIEKSSSIFLKNSYYISEHVNYDFDFRALIHQPKFPDRVNILEQFTEFTFKLHENDVDFLDHSPGNTLINKNENDTYDFYLIDLNRMRFKTMSFDDRMHNFRRLWLSKTMLKIMANKYAGLIDRSFEETHNLMLKHSRAFQKKIDSKKLRRSGRKLKFKR